MKLTVATKILAYCISLLSLTAVAQCPSISNLSIVYGANGTATVTPILSGITNPNSTSYYWDTSTGVIFTNSNSDSTAHLQSYANNHYQVCLMLTDSLQGCFDYTCTIVTFSNVPSVSCSPSFTSYTDSSCVTHLVNSSIGNSLTYQWYLVNPTNNVLIGSTPNPSTNLPNGNNQIILYTYSNGVFCDSVIQTINVGCSGNTHSDSCQTSFYSYTDSLCETHFINTSTTFGGSSSSQWYINGITYNTTNVDIILGNGIYEAYLYNYSNGTLCDSTFQYITVSCNIDTISSDTCLVNSFFAIFADSTNTGNYFAYNLSSGNGNLSFLWNFGDGTTSTQEYPIHQYAVPGQYIICLTVTSIGDSSICTETYCDSSSVYKMAEGFLMSQISVIPQNTTSIKTLNKKLQFVIYPNPIDNVLTIRSSEKINSTYTITDALNKIVLFGSIDQITTINTSELEKGYYNLTISDENNQKTNIKLIK